MNSEGETVERTVKVELHFHVSLAAAPGPDWTAGASGDRNEPRFYPEPPRKSRWIAKSFGALSLLAAAAVGVSLVHGFAVGPGNRAEFAAAAPPPPLWVPSAPAGVDTGRIERPVAGEEAPQGGANPPRRGTTAFGLH